MRESLISISEHVGDMNLKIQIFNIALNDVITSWLSTAADSPSNVFSSSEVLLAHISTNHPQMPAIRHILNTILHTAKRVATPIFPIEIWTRSTLVLKNDLINIFPFANVWFPAMSLLFKALKEFHKMWHPIVREQLQNQNPMLSNLMVFVPVDGCKEIHSKVMSILSNDANSVKSNHEVREIRVLLYLILAQASIHKVIYLCEEHTTFISSLCEDFNYLDNAHLSAFTRLFLQPYLLNALPVLKHQFLI